MSDDPVWAAVAVDEKLLKYLYNLVTVNDRFGVPERPTSTTKAGSRDRCPMPLLDFHSSLQFIQIVPIGDRMPPATSGRDGKIASRAVAAIA
jgi:hypothetical protein